MFGIEKLYRKVPMSYDTKDVVIILLNKENIIDINKFKSLKECGIWVYSKGNKIRVLTKMSLSEIEILLVENTDFKRNEFMIIDATDLFPPIS